MNPGLQTSIMTHSHPRMPTLFLSHGGGPCFFIKPTTTTPATSWLEKMGAGSHACRWFQQVPHQLGLLENGVYGKPTAIVVISAHWQASRNNEVCITKQHKHTTLTYDYVGFPKETYAPYFTYPAPGKPQLAEKIVQLINTYSKQNHQKPPFVPFEDTQYNFDHGVFVPLKLMYPEADIPVVEISINRNWSAEWHIQLGEALAPLRNEGVLIVGSGFIVHNMRGQFYKSELAPFVEAVQKVIEDEHMNSQQRIDAIKAWTTLPMARDAHPEEDHLVPLFVVMGAAGGARGTGLNTEWRQDMLLQSFAFH